MITLHIARTLRSPSSQGVHYWQQVSFSPTTAAWPLNNPASHSRNLHTSLNACAQRSVVSKAAQDPHFLTRQLARDLQLPVFPARGDQLHILQDPTQFYQELKGKIGQAKERIFFASLYIGKEETELIECLESALRKNPSLELTILVDALRGTREAAPTPSCASLISKLHAQYPGRVNLRLYHTPNLKGWLKKVVGKRFNEGWGLQHMKIYGFDNDVVISGANLSRDYFTNRQDRYLLVEDHKQVADYLYSLVHAVGQFSFKLESVSREPKTVAEQKTADWKLVWDGGKDCPNPWQDGTRLDPYAEAGWTDAATKSVEDFTRRWQKLAPLNASEKSASEENADTLLLPLLQMGPLNIRQETRAIPKILDSGLLDNDTRGGAATLGLTSGYFSLYRPYKALLLQARSVQSAIVKIICAAPEANGFFQSKGVSGWIPEAYTWYEYQFWRSLRRSKRLLGQGGRKVDQGGVQIREWNKNGWTYHAKGIWYSPPSTEAGLPSGPTMVHVGSSNYGSRSADLDLECTFLISTQSKELSHRFKEEFESLERDAKDVVDEQLFQRPDRKVRRRVRLASWLLRGML